MRRYPRNPSLKRWLALLLLIGVHASCVKSSSTRPARPKRAPVEVLPTEPPALDATRYSTGVTPHPGGIAGLMAKEIVAIAANQGIELLADGKLSDLGRWAAYHVVDMQLPTMEQLHDVAHRLGVVEPTPTLQLMRGRNLELSIGLLGRSIGPALMEKRYTHVGVGIVKRGKVKLCIIVLSSRLLELAPMERMHGAVKELEFSGALLEGLSGPHLVVEYPDGEIRHEALGTERVFSTRLTFPAPGTYRVELLGDGELGPTVVANFPVYIGVDEPRLPGIERIPDASTVQESEDEVVAELLRLIDRDRTAEGLEPMIRRTELDAVALGHCRDMFDNGFTGHTSPTTGSVPDRLKDAGIETALAAENVALATTSADIHEGLMASPAHRAAILHPDLTHIGIAAVRKVRKVVGRRSSAGSFLVTQVFTRDPL